MRIFLFSPARVSRPSILSDVDSSEAHDINECDDCSEDLWHTSVGKFRFSLEDLPPQLQYFHVLLKVTCLSYNGFYFSISL